MFYEILTDSFNGIRINTGDNVHRVNEFHQGKFSCLLTSLQLWFVTSNCRSTARQATSGKTPEGVREIRTKGRGVGELALLTLCWAGFYSSLVVWSGDKKCIYIQRS